MNDYTKDSAEWEKQLDDRWENENWWVEFNMRDSSDWVREQVKQFIRSRRLLSKECPHFIGPNEQAKCIICNSRPQ